MITWITRFSFERTARDLDSRALGYQILQAKEVYDALTGAETSVEETHPILRMWEGYEVALGVYGMQMGLEYTSDRRQIDSIFFETARAVQVFKDTFQVEYEEPPWLQDADLCRSHRSNLARRRPDTYGKTWAGTPPNMPYLWPFIDPSHPDGYKLMVSKVEKDLLASKQRNLPKSIAERVANL